MKRNNFLIKSCVLMILAGIVLVSCADKAELSFSSRTIEFDPLPVDTMFVDIYSNVKWTVHIVQDGTWLTVTPLEGVGNGRINIKVEENATYLDRIAKIAIIGDGFGVDTIKVTQTKDVDITALFRDRIFREYMINEFDLNKDGSISSREANKIETLRISRRQIESLSGIENLTQLRYLDCSSNLISNLDLSKNTRLTTLICDDNYIERLDLTNNLALIDVQCNWNSLVNLDVTGLTNLVILEAWLNNLERLDVESNINLQELRISGNRISSLNVNNNKKLMYLVCTNNRLQSLDLRNNTELVTLYCGENRLSTLNLHENTKLQNFRCDYNEWFSGGTIDVSRNTELREFSCMGNRFTSLNLTNNINLEQFTCEGNNLTSLDLTRNTKLFLINAASNSLSSLDLRNITLRNLFIDLKSNPNLAIVHVPVDFILFATCNDNIEPMILCDGTNPGGIWVESN